LFFLSITLLLYSREYTSRIIQTEVSSRQEINKSDWRNNVVYQIYPRSFQEGVRPNGSKKGNGNLNGVIDRLGYLQEVLGVDTIWFSPVFPSPLKDGGYDITDHRNIHEMYGDLNTMDRLIAEVHNRGMRMLLDLVPNHTSDQHPRFQESRSSEDNLKRNWYHWRKGKPDGSPPNNWISVFDNTEGSAWTYDEQTGEYYLHSFDVTQPDLKWDNPEVEEEMHDTITFWMDRGVDGFRIDVGLYIMKDPQYPDEPLNPDYREGVDHPNEIYIHTVSKDQPSGREKLKDLGKVITKRGGFVAYEVYVKPEERVLLYDSSEKLDGGQSAPFDFDLILGDWNAKAVKKAIFDYYKILGENAIVALPIGNHDQSRVASRLGSQEDARLAAMLQLTLDCIPFIYQGEEIGMEDVEIPEDRRQDPFKGKPRDPQRTPMQWTMDPNNAGFTDENVKPWLPVAPDSQTRNVEAQKNNPLSMLSLYKQLITFRKEKLAPGRPVEVDVKNDKVMAYTRKTTDGKEVVVLLNFSDSNEQIDLSSLEFDSSSLIIRTSLQQEAKEIINHADFSLDPKEGYIFEL